jgi:DNA-binding response OmpR family regulator
LTVDDNRDSVDSLGMLLRIIGNNVRTAYDGERGIAATDEFRPDAALFDLGLLKVDGYTACRRMRGQAWDRSMVLIAVTGWGQAEDGRRSHEQ